MTTPFCQNWVSSGSILSNFKNTQVLKSLPAGIYKFTADVRVYSEAGRLDSFKGATMFMGDERINLQDGQAVTYSDNKSVLWAKDYYNVIAIVKEAGDIELGFEIQDANFNWIAFKNTSLTYYGNSDVEANAVALYKSLYQFEEITEGDANAELINAYNKALDNYNSASSIDEIKNATIEMNAAQSLLLANMKAYTTLMEKIYSWQSQLASKQDLAGPEWDNFSDFMQFTNPVEGYPTPTAAAISNGDRTLTTEEIASYISTVKERYAYTVAHSLGEGSDCIDMLVNPSFADGFNG